MKFNEIIKHEEFESIVSEMYSELIGYTYADDDLGEVQLVHSSYGLMGDEQQDVDLVLKFGDVLVGVSGDYSSYGGFEINSTYEVKPVEKMVTVYEKVEVIEIPKTKDGLESLLNKHRDSLFYFMDSDSVVYSDDAEVNEVDIDKLGFGKFEYIETYNRDEYGAEAHSIVYFKDFDLHARFDGYYSSYGGHTFKSFKFVSPKEKTVTVYE